MKKAILFDVGNTLLRIDFKSICHIFGTVYEENVCKKLEAQLLMRINTYYKEAYKGKSLFNHMFEPIVNYYRQDLQEALEKLKKFDQQYSLWNQLSCNVVELFDILREHDILMGIVSNSDGRVNNLLESKGIAGYFNTIIDSHIVKVAKPNQQIFELAIKEIGLSCNDIYYVGDIPYIDVVGSAKAGMTPILYDPFDIFKTEITTLEKQFSKKIHVVNDLLKIQNVIQ